MIQNKVLKSNISVNEKTLLKKGRGSVFFFLSLLLLVGTTGCSSYQSSRPQVRNTPLPEVTRPQVRRPQVQRPNSRNMQVNRPIVQKPKPVATVHRYSDKPKTEVITQREAQTVLQKTTEESNKIEETKSEATPYDKIPDNSEATQQNESSPAVKSLMIRARADMAIGRDQSAISKIERALRIESDNAELWYLLAKAHQSSSNHQQAISMAKKAISFAGSNETMAIKSWKLIKLSGEASGDTIVVQEAINYSKVHP